MGATPGGTALGQPAPECINTPLRPLQFERELAVHPDKDFAHQVVHGIRFGVKIGYAGPQLPLITSNLPSADLNPGVIDDTLCRECELGRVAGPFPSPPLRNFRSSGIGLVPKKDGSWRMIHHLSAPMGQSINDFIDPEGYSLSYPSIDEAAAILVSFGRGTMMTKMDLKSAFRQVPVHPSDWHLLGLSWRDQFYYDKCLPFGLRSSPFLFNRVGTAVEWIIKKHGVQSLIRYLDDFLTFGRPGTSECYHNKATMLEVCQSLGVAVNPQKTLGPSTHMEFLGITFDSTRMVMSLSAEKIQELLSDLRIMHSHRTCKKRLLLQLIGKLSFACKVVPAGRIFLRRLIDKSTEVSPLHHHVTLDKSTKADMAWWLAFLPPWSGTAMIIDPAWNLPAHFQLYTDASSLIGFGAFWDGSWFNGRWAASMQQMSITWKELYAVVLATSTWGHHWKGKSVLFHCDNSAVVEIWAKRSTKQPSIMALVRVLHFIAAKHEFHVTVQHIPGTNNTLADALSRLQAERFRHLAPYADTRPTAIVEPHQHSTTLAETYSIFSGLL